MAARRPPWKSGKREWNLADNFVDGGAHVGETGGLTPYSRSARPPTELIREKGGFDAMIKVCEAFDKLLFYARYHECNEGVMEREDLREDAEGLVG